jgi:putative Mg2+ transporter-C (MgtC) family protein
VWLTACVGIMCGAGHWRIVTVSVVIAFLVLLFGGKVERALHRAFGGKDDPASIPVDPPQSSDAGPHQPGK